MDKIPFQLQFEKGNSGKYNVKIIPDNMVYSRELEGQLLALYYLIL